MEPLLPRGRRGAHRVDDRRVISGLMHMLHSGARWRDCAAAYVHALTDERGWPRAFELTAGNVPDLAGARALLAVVPCPLRLIADRAYDARSLRDWLAVRGAEAVIPPNPTRKHPHSYDATPYRERNLIERICRLKGFRRIATRYDKLARNFLAGVLIAAALTWWLNGP